MSDGNYTVLHLLLDHKNSTVPAKCTSCRTSPPFCHGRRKCALGRTDPLKALAGTVPHHDCCWGSGNGDRNNCHGKAGSPSEVAQFTDAHEIWHRQWLLFHCWAPSHSQQNPWAAAGSSQKQSSRKNGMGILISRDCTCFSGSYRRYFCTKMTRLLLKSSTC